MRLFSGFNWVSVIGLNISSREIHAVQLKRKGSHIKLGQWERLFLGQETIQEGKIKDPDTLSLHLDQLVRRMGWQNAWVSIALPHPCVISKRLKLPAYLGEEECEAEIKEQLNRYLPGVDEELNFDFVVIDKKQDDHQEIQLFVTRQAQLDVYVKLVQAVGLKVIKVDVDLYAMAHAVKWRLANKESPFCLMYFYEDVHVIFIDKNAIVFAQSFTIDFMLQDAAINLSQQIKSILQIHSVSLHHLDQFVLLGEVPFKWKSLQDALGVKMQMINLFDHLEVANDLSLNELQANATHLSVALGLALRGLSIC